MKTENRWLLAAGAAALSLAGLAVPALADPGGCPAGAQPRAVAARSGGHDILVALPSDAVVLLPGYAGPVALRPVAEPAPVRALPGLRLIAEMQAMMHRMTARMDRLIADPSLPVPGWAGSPFGLIRAAFGPHPWTATGPGTRVMITSVTTGQGGCAESVSYRYPAAGGKPIVTVSRTGTACAAIQPGGPGLATAAAPAARPLPSGPRLIPADYRVHIAPTATAPRA